MSKLILTIASAVMLTQTGWCDELTEQQILGQADARIEKYRKGDALLRLIAPFDAKQAKQAQQQWARHIGKEVVFTNSIGMKLTLIPPGEFTMGRTEEQFDKVLEIARKEGRNPARLATWEMLMTPAHRVRITKPFYMAATEVTVGQFRQFCDATGDKTEAERGLHGGRPYKGRRPICTWRKPMVWIKLKQKDDEPVLHLCWNDCLAFCRWLTEKEGNKGVEYCLPTEAQWEYACRAGTTTAWSFGNFEDFDRFGHQYVFVSDGKQGKHDRPSRVAQKKPNPPGLYDMHGGVWEWCQDWYDADYYLHAPLVDPAGPKSGRFRVLRGGSWFRYAKDCRSAYRKFFFPEGNGDGVTAWINDFGCRLVINLDDKD